MQEPVNARGNAIEAVRHADPYPYPYYRCLREQQPLFFDPLLGSWVASSAGAVKAALADDRLQARPASEPVPAALLGTAAADVFALLVRMNDGLFHAGTNPKSSLLQRRSGCVKWPSTQSMWRRRCTKRSRPTSGYVSYPCA